KVDRWLAVVGAIAYTFATFSIVLINAGHNTKLLTIYYLPAMLAGLFLVYRAKWWSGVPLLAFSLAFMIQNSHYQVLYYVVIMVVFMVISFLLIAIKEKKLGQFFKASALSLLVAVVALGPSMQKFLTAMEYNKTTMRGGESEL